MKSLDDLKKEKDAVILAHYYVPDEVQKAADYVGDSYYLSSLATTLPHSTIVLCGVKFMAESAKLLNPQKTVLLPELAADCPMAHMADFQKIEAIREQYKDVAVVCYINSTAELKTYSDVCVTSSNAVKIVSALPNKYIYFIPDEHLGRFVASKVPEKHFLYNDGFCHVHTSITRENLIIAKEHKPDAKVLAHPECPEEVVKMADYIGSTSGIINYAVTSDASEFIICTEMGILYELNQKTSGKHFYSVGHRQFCPNMKKITLDKVIDVLSNMNNTIELDEQVMNLAAKPLEKMLELAR
jgi:quinolinate synthase